MSKVSVIIPAYNEEQGIHDTLSELINAVPGEYEIIVVDDGSTDATVDIVSQFVPRVKLIKHKVNRGYGTAIKTASRASEGDIIVWYDADGQHRPEDLLSTVDCMLQGNLDYCIGIRTKDSHVDKNRRLGKKVLSGIANLLAREPMEDVNSGMRAFKREVLIRHLGMLPERFGASTVTSFIMQEMDYRGGTIPITVRAREGTSTVRPIKDGIATLRLIMNVVLLFRAKQVFAFVAVLFVLIGSIYGVSVALIQRMGIPVLAAILIIVGIQMYFLGILSAQISALRLER